MNKGCKFCYLPDEEGVICPNDLITVESSILNKPYFVAVGLGLDQTLEIYGGAEKGFAYSNILGKTNINYCPVCGKKLENPVKEGKDDTEM